MQNCLGIYIENNLIKYAKVSKEKEKFKVESFGIRFFENLNDEIDKIIEETYSYNTPISINLANEKYLYFNVFALLKKEDIKRTIETEFVTYCEENKYNIKAFETKYALVQNVEDKEKIRAIQVVVNKIEFNKQKQHLEKRNLYRILPIGTAITSIAKLEKKENVLIVNMEEKTTITTIFDRQIYDVEILDFGSQEVLEKINRIENSMQKAYDICKESTIYTSNIIEDTREQPHLENIMPTLYQICQSVREIIEKSPLKISEVYLTGNLSTVNNVDLYFQDILTNVECKILRPNIIEEGVSQINIKDYIEVNSAISLAMQALGEGMQALNFKKANIKDKINELKASLPQSDKKPKEGGKRPKIEIDFSMKGSLAGVEKTLLRLNVAVILVSIIFIVFSRILYSQMQNKQEEVEKLIASENAEIAKINNDINSLNSKNKKYTALTAELKAMNDKISNIAERKNTIPNLLNQIMFIIPETVQLTSIKNTTDKKIVIVAQADKYDQLGYFIAKIKVEGILKNTISSSGQKNANIVTVTIEGELP